jgi:small subunit ribosomal protein S1
MQQDIQATLTEDNSLKTLQVGDNVRGIVSKLVREIAFVSLSESQEAYINLAELRGEDGSLSIELGDEIEAQVVHVQRGIQLSRKPFEQEEDIKKLQQAIVDQTVFKGLIVRTKGNGYELRLNNMRAFCSFNEFSYRKDKRPQRHIGQTFDFHVKEVKRGKNLKIIASRLAILEEEKAQKAILIAQRFKAGDVIQGKVTQLANFGVFVDVGDGIEGLIPMSELSHSHVAQASQVVKSKEEVEVKVIAINPERQRLTLSLRQLTPDPWDVFVASQKVGNTIEGKVTRLVKFGAFVELAPQVEGLLHIGSISSTERINHPSDRYEEGQIIEVILEEVVRSENADSRRLRLMTPEVAEQRKPIDINLSVGEVVSAPIVEVKEQGVSLQITSQLRGFIPSSETGTERGANLGERFKTGQEISAKIIQLDLKRKRVRLSIKAMENHEEEMAFKNYKVEEAKQEMSGSFGDLLKGFLK